MPITDKEKYNKYQSKYQNARYKTRRSEFIQYLGGVCKGCGTTENLEFDHIDSKTKSFDVAKVMVRMNYDLLRAEIDKCQLLCTKCHLKKSREAGDLKDVEHGGGLSGKRNCKCDPCKTKKAAYMKSNKPKYNEARKAKRKAKKAEKDGLNEMDS